MQIVALVVLLLHMFILIGLLKGNLHCPSIHSTFIACLSQAWWSLQSSWMTCKFLNSLVNHTWFLDFIFFSMWKLFRYYNNAYYAKVGGISTTEMNFLEVDFLFGLGFQLNVTPNTFNTYYSYLKRETMLQQCPPSMVESSLSLGRSLNHHLCFNEEDSTHQNQQLAV